MYISEMREEQDKGGKGSTKKEKKKQNGSIRFFFLCYKFCFASLFFSDCIMTHWVWGFAILD